MFCLFRQSGGRRRLFKQKSCLAQQNGPVISTQNDLILVFLSFFLSLSVSLFLIVAHEIGIKALLAVSLAHITVIRMCWYTMMTGETLAERCV